MDKRLTPKILEKKQMLWWRNRADLDQIINEREDLIIKDRKEIDQAQPVQLKYIC